MSEDISSQVRLGATIILVAALIAAVFERSEERYYHQAYQHFRQEYLRFRIRSMRSTTIRR